MPNPFINRQQVHAWSEMIGDDPQPHQAALSRVLKDQRRITKFIEENAESMQSGTGGIATYLVGVIARMFDLAGGRLKSASWEQMRDAEAKVGGQVAGLMPLDAGFPERVRAVPGRAQPHIVDEAIMALFDRPKKEDEPDLAEDEKAKVLFLLWVAVEVLDANWRPPSGFIGEKEYTYSHITPKPR